MKILCGQCGQMSLTDDKDVAKIVSCTHCGHEIGNNGSAGAAPIFDVEPEDQAFAAVVRTSLARKIHVNCGACGRGLKVNLRMAGRKTTCPACGQQIFLPLAGQEAERRIEEYLAERNRTAGAAETGKPAAASSSMHFDETELAELATYVETGSSDDIALEIPEDDDLMHRTADGMEGREILALNAAISAITPRRGTSAEVELPALQRAVKERTPKTTEGMSGRTKAIIGAVAATIVIGIGLWFALSGTETAGPDVEPDSGLNSPPIVVKPGVEPVTPPKIEPPIVEPPKIPAVKIIAACRAMTSSTDSFVGDGFFPAAPDQVYCRISMQVKAGDDQLELYNFGKYAVLKIGLDSYQSMGEPVKAILPTPPVKKRLTVSPHQTRTVTMLFQLPCKALKASGTKGIVAMGSMAPASVTLDGAAHVLPARAVASQPYVEIAPRNTKPLLRDPVMSAIQSVTPQQLSILPGAGDDSVKLKLGSGQVTGTATRDPRGLYVTKLTHNGSSLDCLLRFERGGKRAILYLSEEPFHQLTFAQPGASRAAPVVPQTPGSAIWPKPANGDKTRPDKPKPRPRPAPRPSNGGGRRPGFFGV